MPRDVPSLREAFFLRRASFVPQRQAHPRAKEAKLPILVGGSDLHHAGGEGSCLLRTKERPENAAALIAILKSGEYALQIGGSIVLP